LASWMLNARNTEKNTVFLFMLSLFCEYGNLQYLHVHVIHRVNQAEYGIRIRVAASQEDVNLFLTRRVGVRVVADDWESGVCEVHPSRRGGGELAFNDIVITNMIWCMTYKREVEGGSYLAQLPWYSIATLWAMQVGGNNKRTIHSYTNNSK